METTKLYLHEISKEDKRKFYSQEVFQGFSEAKTCLCLMVTIIFLFDCIVNYIIQQHISTAKPTPFSPVAVISYAVSLILYTLSYVEFIQRIFKNTIRVRIILNSIAGVVFSISIFYFQYERLKTALETKQEDDWIISMTFLSYSIYTIMMANLVSPMWYLKVIIVGCYYLGTMAAFIEAKHHNLRWIIVRSTSSASIYVIVLAAGTNYIGWIIFLRDPKS